MKLDDFLKEKTFLKYADVVQDIKAEFVLEGCEKYLWTTFSEQKAAMEYTKRILTKRHYKVNDKIKLFIMQFDNIDFETKVAFIYPENNSQYYFIARELAKSAEKSYVINNIFDEDDTVNWISIFDKKSDVIEEMFHVIYSAYMSDNYGGYKIFGYGLMYYADLLEYDGKMLQADWPLKYGHFQGINTRRDTNPFIILESRKTTKMLIDLKYFQDELELHWNMQNHLLPFLQKMYDDVLPLLHNTKWKEHIAEVRSLLVANGIINGKWKNEQSLFKMVKSLYCDAIFQYRPRWLQPQSIDIYIPSLKVGIEYQGVQHYQGVEFFGGEEAFAHRVELDRRKELLCISNNVHLVHWPYVDPITKKRVQEILKKYENTMI